MNMYVFFLLTILNVTQCKSRPQQILSQSSKTDENGYSFSYDTSDGQHREEVGTITYNAKGDSVLRVTGSYSYIGSDGRYYKVSYEANENGYQPTITVSDHVRTVPAIGVPEEEDGAIEVRIGTQAITSLVGGGLG